MSATRDSSQKPTFVFTNLYELFKKSQEIQNKNAPQTTPDQKPLGVVSGTVLKMGQNPVAPKIVQPYEPVELMNKRVEEMRIKAQAAYAAQAAGAKAAQQASQNAVQDLRKNLGDLKDLQSRLRFMLQELEDLLKK